MDENGLASFGSTHVMIDINTYHPTGPMSYLFDAEKLWLIGILVFNVNQKMIADIICVKV